MDLFTLVGKIAIDSTEAETKIDSLLTKAGQLNAALDGTGGTGGTGTTGATSTGTTSASGTTTAQAVATGNLLSRFIEKAINVAGGWVVDWGKEGYAYEVDKEKYIAELKTMMDSTWEEAESFFNDLNTLSITTPLNMSSIGTGASRFLSLGYKPDQIMEMMQVIGDLAKGDNFTFERIVKAVSDVMGKSELQAQERNQFSEAGIPLYALLADYYGMPYETDEDKTFANGLFMERQKDREISSADVWNALVKATQEGGRFYNAMDIAMETHAGQAEKSEELKQQYAGKILEQTGFMDISEAFTKLMNYLMESEINRLDEDGLFYWKNLVEDFEITKDFLENMSSPTNEGTQYVKPRFPGDWNDTYHFDPNKVDFQSGSIETLSETIGNAVKSAIAESVPGAITSGMGEVSISAGSVTLNDGVLVGRILPRINIGLGQMAARDMRGNA